MANGDEHLHIGYFRHGEVALLLKPVDKELTSDLMVRRPPDEQPPLDQDTLDALGKLFARTEVDIPLYETEGDSQAPIRGSDANGRLRRILPMHRADLQVLQIVNLRSWIKRPVVETDHGRLFRSMTDVADAVRRVNELIAAQGKQPVGKYLLTAAAPNWLATQFNC